MTSLCLLHISKTSGTSVNLYLESQFLPSEICPARFGDEFGSLGPSKLQDFRLFRAECGAGVLDLLPAGIPVVTLLREPLARTWSHWRYVQRLPDHRLHEQFQSEHGGFGHFVDSLPPNPMARLLAAGPGDPIGGVWDQTVAESADDDELLDRAVARLESCAVVGLAEEHDETVALIADHFGWAPPGRLPVTNAAPPADVEPAPDPADRDRFAARHSVDAELYAIASALFERRQRLSDGPTRAARHDERVAVTSQPLLRRRVIDLRRPVVGSGWLRVVDTDSGPMRPVGPGGEATLDVPVTLGRFTKLEVTCPAISSVAVLESFRLTVNGRSVPVGHRVDPGGITLHAALPPTGPGERFTRLGFSCSGGVAVPTNHTGAMNDMDATLAVSRVEVIPYDPGSLRLGRGRRPVAAAPMARAARFFWQRSPAWTFDADLQRRLGDLDLWPHVADLQRDGFTVVPNVIGDEIVVPAREALRRLAVGSAHRTRSRDVLQPLRVDPLFMELLLHPVQLALADAVCGKGQLDSQAGLVRDRNSNPQGLHAENSLWLPAPYPEHHFLCSSMLTLDTFDEPSGGTCFVPGSHLTRLDPTPEDSHRLTGTVTPEVEPGSLIVWVGGTWHGARQRVDPGERVSLLTIFSRPCLRPAQDLRTIPAHLVSSDELRVRLRRSDPFEQDGWYDDDPGPMLHWIRNTPREGDLTFGWGDVLDPATVESGQPPEHARPEAP